MSLTASVTIDDSQGHESTVRDWFSLLKPGVMSLVVFTGLTGMLLAPGSIHPLLAITAILAIAIGSGAGAALNMWYDRDIDAIMHRTSKRALPAGRIAPDDALVFGLALSLASVSLLGLATNWVAGGILAFAIFFYAVIYTAWLKRSTPQNIVIGGAAGAFPPVIGWAAVTGTVDPLPLALFLIVFLWTPPHFWALALFRNDDYRRANVPMLPVVAGIEETTRQMVIYTILLILASFAPVLLSQAGVLYTVAAALLGQRFLSHALTVRRTPEDALSRRMFGFSILYLFALMSALLLDKAVDKWWFFSFMGAGA